MQHWIDSAAVVTTFAGGYGAYKSVVPKTSVATAGKTAVKGAGNSVGAARRLAYEASPKHGATAKGSISAAPRNGHPVKIRQIRPVFQRMPK